ncbi:MAG TPA: 50S ribosomal protein L15 [Anaerolineae bacterium]|mgnify:CR=1 FL=1|nr:50S ribosomal protein L15 [Anaerolineae bacterium]HMR62421.1 50S ribosomal protein L15 [Anaerolineae bacterium]
MKLHDLQPAPGSKKHKKRVGRGMASGKGKTSGRGMKGQKARSGGGKGPFFEGGQLPLVRRLPFRRGFTNIHRVEFKPVNLSRLQEKFGEGDLEVTPETLVEAGIIKQSDKAVAILGEGELGVALTVKAHRFSKSAKEKIEAAGGTVEVLALA